MPATARPTVAFDVTPLLGVRTGIGNAVAEMYAALQGLDAAPDLVPYTLSLRARQMREDVPSDTRFVPLPARGLLKAWARANTPRIDRWITPARVVHATNYLAPATRLPTVVSVYDCSFVRYPELCTPEVLAFVPILRRAIERGATVHTTSEFVATEIEEAFGARRRDGKLVVVPLGVPPLGTEAAMPADLRDELDGAPYVLAVGMLEPRKNFPHLIGAFGALAASHPELRLVIVGPDGPARPSVERAVERLPAAVRPRVLLPGAVDNLARRALLDAAAVLAYPSIYEGFGF
ncbi:MAG TPA: glycosyltransferase, partial [Acidimicrobiia bacterium]|nr:glycosyltransferase [Acidimicrobiia bacterium]